MEKNPRQFRTGSHFILTAVFILLALLTTGCAPALLSAQLDPLPTLAPLVSMSEPAVTDGETAVSVPPTFTPEGMLAVGSPPSSVTATPATPPIMPTSIPTIAPISPIPTVPFDPIVATAEPTEAPSVLEGCGENGRLQNGRFPSEFGGPTRPYHIYLPPCYGQDGRVYPVLYLFHGSVQTDTHWIDLGLIPLIEDKILSGQYPPFIVVMPDNGELGNVTSGDERSIEGITVNALMPYIEANYCTWNNPNGRSLGGISRGGYWALMIAFRHTDLFGSVSGHSSHLRLETDKAEYNPLGTYETADLTNLRIWLDWGESDFLRLGQQQLKLLLQQKGANLDSIVHTGGHNDTYWRAHLPEYMDWHTAVWSLDRTEYPPCELQ